MEQEALQRGAIHSSDKKLFLISAKLFSAGLLKISLFQKKKGYDAIICP